MDEEKKSREVMKQLGWNLVPAPERGFSYDVVDSEGVVVPESEIDNLVAREIIPAKKVKKKICGVGDSWIDILYPLSSVLGYPPCFYDFIKRSGKYRALELGHPGLTLRRILSESPRRYQAPIGSGTYDYFVFSASGNDIAGVPFSYMLKHKTSVKEKNKTGSSYINKGVMKFYLRNISRGYNRVVKEVWRWSSGRTSILIHGYDVPIPIKDGPFFGKFFSEKGYDLEADAKLIQSIMTYLIGQLYKTLNKVRDDNPDIDIIVVNLMGIVGSRWHDELHPTRKAAKDVAQEFMKVLDRKTIIA